MADNENAPSAVHTPPHADYPQAAHAVGVGGIDPVALVAALQPTNGLKGSDAAPYFTSLVIPRVDVLVLGRLAQTTVPAYVGINAVAAAIIAGCTNALIQTALTTVQATPTGAYARHLRYRLVVQMPTVWASDRYPVAQAILDAGVESLPDTEFWADITPPTIVSTAPIAGAVAVPSTATVSIVFAQSMDITSLTTGTIVFTGPTGAVVVSTLGYSDATKTLIITPAVPFAAAGSYTLRVIGGVSGVKNAQGNTMVSDYNLVFVATITPAVDIIPPTVTGTVPANGATAVSRTAAVQAVFSEPLEAASVTGANFTLTPTAGGAAVAGAVAFNAATNTLSFTPAAAITALTQYTAVIKGGSTGVKDLAGNPLAFDVSWPFTTGA